MEGEARKDLLDRLNEIKTDVDVKHCKEESFSPIRVADVRETLKLVAEEDVALAALIPQLINQGRLDEAKQLNTSLHNPVKKLTEERGVTSVMGISPTLLESNAMYIDTLQTRILNLIFDRSAYIPLISRAIKKLAFDCSELFLH